MSTEQGNGTACEDGRTAGKIGGMEIAAETERKYDVPADFALPKVPGANGGRTHELDATYFDTPDLRLARNKRTLRRRTGGDDAGWHLKTPGEGSSRTEHRLPLESSADDVPEELLDEVRAIVRDSALRPVARLRTHRIETPVTDDDGRTLALIAQDTVTAETDDGAETWQEVEVELADGDAGLLDVVERKLRKAGATPADGPSKLARALASRLPKDESKKIDDPILLYVREQRDAILSFDPGVRRGDPESVHKMRVGTRRLRSTLKTFKRSFHPGQVAYLNPELRWLAGQLGEVRDGQVLERKLLASVDGAGEEFAPVAERIRTYLDAKIEAGRAALAEDLNDARYFRLLDAVDDLVATWAGGESQPIRRARKSLAEAEGLLDEARLADDDEPLHEARKAYKRARYAVEAFGRREKLVDKLTDLQDVLGAHQDSVVAREILRELAAGAEDAFPYGILYARQERVAEDTLGELPGAVDASRRRKLRSWLDS